MISIVKPITSLMTTNLIAKESEIDSLRRSQLMGQQSFVIWLTGLSGAGKSSIAAKLEAFLFEKGFKPYLLDGDDIRQGLNKDLSFSDVDRKENIRRIGEVAKIMANSGLVVIAAFISPFEKDSTV